jgi:hypothetical protein
VYALTVTTGALCVEVRQRCAFVVIACHKFNGNHASESESFLKAASAVVASS